MSRIVERRGDDFTREVGTICQVILCLVGEIKVKARQEKCRAVVPSDALNRSWADFIHHYPSVYHSLKIYGGEWN
jgi:hypothetical protein